VAKPTVGVEGLSAFRRDLKRLEPLANQQLRKDLKDIADRVAVRAQARMGAESFGYQGVATPGLRATVRSTGRNAFVARFIDFGFHPRGSSTFVPGRNIVGGVLEQQEERIVDDVGDAIERAAVRAGWH
jgi:hypothetical protein